MHRFLISAAHKSSGKTMVSIGLAAALRRRGLTVQPFKKGPDYIDPIWLGLASGRPCRNLDFNLSTGEELRLQFARHAATANVCLVEGNKGLYDGLDLDGGNSNAALARLLELPVVLVLDARGMTRGIAPLILGYQAFDPAIRIAGVILNRLGGARHEAKLRAVIEHYTDVPVIGAVAEDPALTIAERHLGLMPANESTAAERHIARLAEVIGLQVDIARLLALTATPPPVAPPLQSSATAEPVRIGLARDRAFGFYYHDDLEALERAGAVIVPFDTLSDRRLPAVDGVFIGGGFPERLAGELEANAGLRHDLLQAIEAGLPVYAECGGLMYLARSISWRGKAHRMVGALPADIVMHDKPVGRGYVRLQETSAHPWRAAGQAPAGEIPAHEFHYSGLEHLDPATVFSYRVLRGHGADGAHDGIVHKNVLACYSHFRSCAGYDWAGRFVAFVRQCAAARSPHVGYTVSVS
ncbi:MAG: cobyrinate a,c-diamide synthase [Burkholderiales bacterium]